MNILEFVKKVFNSMIGVIMEESIKPPIRILIITKSRNSYGVETANTLSTGLFNSANHLVTALNKEPSICAEIVSVVDNNSIDREVTRFKPDIVLIEALWVVPEKFEVLKKLHPSVKWVVRLHSETPFLSFEGVAINWIRRYLEEQSIYVALNSQTTFDDFQQIYSDNSEQILYIPNYFTLSNKRTLVKPDAEEVINIGCFGAIRGLKNQLIQAMAAIVFADKRGQQLIYHINTGRNEGFSSENILKNIRELFSNRPEHTLVEYEWMTQSDFYKLLKSTIDLSLQVSFSETFNLVSAEATQCGVPIVVSNDIKWAALSSKVQDATSLREIVQKMMRCYNFRSSVVIENRENLVQSNMIARKAIIQQLYSII